jgi:hypothetical protein
LEDFGGGASVEYFRKDERREDLGIRAEAKGARRAEVLKEEARVFMVGVVGRNVVRPTTDIRESLLVYRRMIT